MKVRQFLSMITRFYKHSNTIVDELWQKNKMLTWTPHSISFRVHKFANCNTLLSKMGTFCEKPFKSVSHCFMNNAKIFSMAYFDSSGYQGT